MQSRLAFWQLPFILMALLTFNLFINTASAHEVRPAIIDFNLNKDNSYQLLIKLNLEALIAKIDIKHANTDDDSNANKYNRLRSLSPFDLKKEFNTFSSHLLKNTNLKFNDKREELANAKVNIPEVGDIDLARDSLVTISGSLPSSNTQLKWSWDASFGNAVFRVNAPNGQDLYAGYLLAGKTSEPVSLGLVTADGSNQKGQKEGVCASIGCKWKVFKNYVEIGFVHILPKGLDHILFVVGLFLLSASLRPLLIQVTTFTLAHSITLALGIYGVVNISPLIVEPLIAASIIAVCIENIYSSKLSRWRPVVIFLFGLLHGLGFASVLKEIGLSPENFATGLIAFNVGVEMGQLTVIAICFFLVGFWFRNKPWYRKRITVPASILIAMIASYWFLERVNLV